MGCRGPSRSTYITGSVSVVRSSHEESCSGFITLSVCEVCWSSEARYECSICKRRVCPAHYNSEKGVCAICYENLCNMCGTKIAVDSCIICGRLVCRDCSVELQPGIRVCGECYANIDRILREEPRLSYVSRFLRGDKKVDRN